MKMIGVDVGGTFTDAVVFDEEAGDLRWAKASSTPGDPAEGVLAAIDRAGVELGSVRRFVHGTTIGTNAFLERKGMPVWMVTSRGFGDTLQIARTNRSVLYDITAQKAEPLVPRSRAIEVAERLYADGSVRTALDMAEIDAAAERLRSEPPQSLIVCFLHSYANPAHEEAAVGRLRELLPGWFVSASADVLPEMREYERFNTAALNGYIGPVTARYLESLAGRMRGRGYTGRIFIMISSGGIVTSERAARYPVQTVLSGPAGGVAAARHFGALLGLRNLVTYDMGGTSTDVCLIRDLQVPVTTDQLIESYPIRTPQIDIHTVGAGGGSIAWIDAGAILNVGPRSAGADPGPACYGRGGGEPTVTDANLVLGRLSADLRLAGSLALDLGSARQALGRICDALPDLDLMQAADGIVRIAIARMVSAIKEISVSRGYDPRDFVLVAFGGAGPLHAALIADEFEMSHVLVPPSPGNFSAFGALISDVRHDHVRSHVVEIDSLAEGALENRFSAMEAAAVAAMVGEGMARERISVERACGMRYVGQSWDLIVPLPAGRLASAALADLFHGVHERRFGYRMASSIEIVSFRVSVIGAVLKPKLPGWAVGGSLADALVHERDAWFSGRLRRVPAYDRERLPCAVRFEGPAIVEEMGAVTIVPPSWSAEVGHYGEMHLRRRAP